MNSGGGDDAINQCAAEVLCHVMKFLGARDVLAFGSTCAYARSVCCMVMRRRVRSAWNPMLLNAQQRRLAFRVLYQNVSVLMCGEAGTGKTFTAEFVVNRLRRDRRSVCICAPTAAAAQLLGGLTIHALFGMTPTSNGGGGGRSNTFQHNWLFKDDLGKCNVLVVDEASAVSCELFEDMNTRLRALRKRTDVPFGGVQVLMIGDFLQLPPISQRNGGGGGASAARYCFESPWFDKLFGVHMYKLTLQQRQRDDSEFSRMLNELRYGRCPLWVQKQLSTRTVARFAAPDPRTITYVFCLKRDVDQHNSTCMAQLPASAAQASFDAQDHYSDESAPEVRKLLDNCVYKPSLELKVGAPVLLIRNIDATMGLVNGTRGVVEAFYTRCELGLPPMCGTCDVCLGTRVSPVSQCYPVLAELGLRQAARKHFHTLPVVRFRVPRLTIGSDDSSSSLDTNDMVDKLYVVRASIIEIRRPPRPTETESAVAATLALDRHAIDRMIDDARSKRINTATSFFRGRKVQRLVPRETDAARAATASSSSAFMYNDMEADEEEPTTVVAAAAAAAATTTPPTADAPVIGEVLASRIQLPLAVAFALTVHKVQGMTLSEGLCFSTEGLFENGQAYVAISRVPSLQRLYVLARPHGFPVARVTASAKAIEFEKRMRVPTEQHTGITVAPASSSAFTAASSPYFAEK